MCGFGASHRKTWFSQLVCGLSRSTDSKEWLVLMRSDNFFVSCKTHQANLFIFQTDNEANEIQLECGRFFFRFDEFQKNSFI